MTNTMTKPIVKEILFLRNLILLNLISIELYVNASHELNRYFKVI
jgi:hypothetical protein